MDAYEAVFSALAHPARRRILMTLNFEGGEMTAGEIASIFEHAWPTTTRHLKVLEESGLIGCERQGRQRLYRIHKPRLDLVQDWLAWFGKKPTGRRPAGSGALRRRGAASGRGAAGDAP